MMGAQTDAESAKEKAKKAAQLIASRQFESRGLSTRRDDAVKNDNAGEPKGGPRGARRQGPLRASERDRGRPDAHRVRASDERLSARAVPPSTAVFFGGGGPGT